MKMKMNELIEKMKRFKVPVLASAAVLVVAVAAVCAFSLNKKKTDNTDANCIGAD